MNRSVVHTVTQISAEQTELIDGDMLSTREFARLCCVSPDWVHARIDAQKLSAQVREGSYYLSSRSVWRAQRMASIEAQYDADPQLAALVADLVDEVRALRARLGQFQVG